MIGSASRAHCARSGDYLARKTVNLVYRRGARNFNPVMATAARHTIAEVDEVVGVGALDPEAVVTPGVYVDAVVRCERPLDVQAVRDLSRRWGRQWDLEVRERATGPRGIPPDLMVRRVAGLLAPGEYVNLGLGLPTLMSSALDPVRGVVLHSENGMLGFGSLAAEGEEDVDCYNASGQLVREQPGASYFDSASAFAMARSGRVTTVVLGGFQVSRTGDLANWNVPATGVGGIGGAMDLAAGAARIVVVMFHLTRDGAPKLVERCTFPLTAARCVRTVVTKINDRYGHIAGDEVLRWFASQCSDVIRQKLDLVGRFGGEEFAIVYPEANLSAALGAAERLRSRIINSAVQYNEMELKITFSAGIATLPLDETIGLDQLIDRADRALYLAKKKRNCTAYWSHKEAVLYHVA